MITPSTQFLQISKYAVPPATPAQSLGLAGGLLQALHLLGVKHDELPQQLQIIPGVLTQAPQLFGFKHDELPQQLQITLGGLLHAPQWLGLLQL